MHKIKLRKRFCTHFFSFLLNDNGNLIAIFNNIQNKFSTKHKHENRLKIKKKIKIQETHFFNRMRIFY